MTDDGPAPDESPGRETLEMGRVMRAMRVVRREQEDDPVANSDYIETAVGAAHKVFNEKGLIAVLFVAVLAYMLWKDHIEDDQRDMRVNALTETLKGVAFTNGEMTETLEALEETLGALESELHDSNLVRQWRYQRDDSNGHER